jgi:antitoxin HicB
MSKKNMGSSIDDFLKEEGGFEEAQAQAIKEVVAWQLADAMKKKRISTSKDGHAAQDDPCSGGRDSWTITTLSSLQSAAAIMGRRVTIELM